MLSMAGRVELVKSVIQSMLVYTIVIYMWSKRIIHRLHMAINHFVWSGGLHNRCPVALQWNEICKPLKEQGLGLQVLTKFSEACLIKLAWGFYKTVSHGAVL